MMGFLSDLQIVSQEPELDIHRLTNTPKIYSIPVFHFVQVHTTSSSIVDTFPVSVISYDSLSHSYSNTSRSHHMDYALLKSPRVPGIFDAPVVRDSVF